MIDVIELSYYVRQVRASALLALLASLIQISCGEIAAMDSNVLLVKSLRAPFEKYIKERTDIALAGAGPNYRLIYEQRSQLNDSIVVLQFLQTQEIEANSRSVATAGANTVCCYLPGDELEFTELYYGSDFLNNLQSALRTTVSNAKEYLCDECSFDIEQRGGRILLNVKGAVTAESIARIKGAASVHGGHGAFTISAAVGSEFSKRGMAGSFAADYLSSHLELLFLEDTESFRDGAREAW